MRIHGRIKIQSVVQIGKQTQHMHLFHCAQLHARQSHQSEMCCCAQQSRAVAAGVMIRQGDHVQPFQGGHTRNVGGGHIVVSARGQAGVQVQVVIELLSHGAFGEWREPPQRWLHPWPAQ